MYKILAADHQIYGPATPAQIRQWQAEGRVNASTMVLADGETVWKPLGTIPEFATPPALIIPPAPPRRENNMALAGLILGVLSNMCCCAGLLCAILGIVFSCIALNRHQANPEVGGKGTALAGLILSAIGLSWHLMPFLIGVPSGLWMGWPRHLRRW